MVINETNRDNLVKVEEQNKITFVFKIFEI